MYDLSHINAIDLRLSHERARAASAHGKEAAWRWHNVAMIEKEREAEVAFLLARGVHVSTAVEDMSDDELLAALTE